MNDPRWQQAWIGTTAGIALALALSACGGAAADQQKAGGDPAAPRSQASTAAPPTPSPAAAGPLTAKGALPTDAEVKGAIGGSAKISGVDTMPPVRTPNPAIGNLRMAQNVHADPACLKAAADDDALNPHNFVEQATEGITLDSVGDSYLVSVTIYGSPATAAATVDSEFNFTIACKTALSILTTPEKLASGSGWKSAMKTAMGSRFDVREAVGPCSISAESHVSAEDADKLAAISAKKCSQS